jgi:hypothetical protein
MQSVNDFISNLNENLDVAARLLAKSVRRQRVFDVIYTGKAAIKTVALIRAGVKAKYGEALSDKQVLIAGKALANTGLVEQIKENNRVAYRKRGHVQQYKSKIFALASSRSKRDAHPTKWRPGTPVGKKQPVSVTVRLSTSGLSVQPVTIDEVQSFAKARDIGVNGYLPLSVSEATFRDGVKRILGESGTFKDWGGESNDLYSSQLRLAGKRRTVAFAFKGPGKRGKLVPGKMGKNGDQIQRLFSAPADVFFVQYHEQIDQSVVDLMQRLAYAKAALTSATVYYGVIDGADSYRLYRAYEKHFSGARRRRRPRKRR